MGTTVESRYVRIGAVCRFILFCVAIAAFCACAPYSNRDAPVGAAAGAAADRLANRLVRVVKPSAWLGRLGDHVLRLRLLVTCRGGGAAAQATLATAAHARKSWPPIAVLLQRVVRTEFFLSLAML